MKCLILLTTCLLLGSNDCVGAETTPEAVAGITRPSILVCEGATIAISPDVAVVISEDSGKVKAELSGLTITATRLRLVLNGASCEVQSGPDGTLSVTPTGTETKAGEGAAFQPSTNACTACYWPTKTAPAESAFAECYEPPPVQGQQMIFPLIPTPHASAVPRTGRIMFGTSVSSASDESWVYVKGSTAWHSKSGQLMPLLAPSK